MPQPRRRLIPDIEKLYTERQDREYAAAVRKWLDNLEGLLPPESPYGIRVTYTPPVEPTDEAGNPLPFAPEEG